MKDLLPKLMSVIGLAKGKKPVVLILSLLAVGVVSFAIHKGWISADVLNVEQIVGGISSAFESDSVKVAIDTVIAPVDTLVTEVVVDSLAVN